MKFNRNYSIKFGLIGNGAISKRHIQAIEKLGGDIVAIYDPKKDGSVESITELFRYDLDYAIICSPSNLHREHIILSNRYGCDVIVEKPMILPWEPLIDSNRVNVVLQYRWLENMPKKADVIKVTMTRDAEYFKSWKGRPKETGGLFYHLFIHYLDLAVQLGANFEGLIQSKGDQVRMIDDFDLMKVDMDDLYVRMYNDIVNHNKGVKPKDIFYLHWLLNKSSEMHGYGINAIDKKIKIKNELL
jgi:predicted dehydrogenase